MLHLCHSRAASSRSRYGGARKAGIQIVFLGIKKGWIPAFPPKADLPPA
ncbi:MAG: hypothetical protein U1A23_04180 [Candidatus Sungbacteria bacterium]|nr:hypothetical protein [Candidatus Sungbacteria bacterium]